jgi:hypothetical protein
MACRLRLTRLLLTACALSASGCALVDLTGATGEADGHSVATHASPSVDAWRAGDWQIPPHATPLGGLAEVRWSGLNLPAQRWTHPSTDDWAKEFGQRGVEFRSPGSRASTVAATNSAVALKGETTAPGGHTLVRAASTEDPAGWLTELPVEVRVDLAIWLADRRPDLSRQAADLQPIVERGSLAPSLTFPAAIAQLAKGTRGRTESPVPVEVSERTRLAAAAAWPAQLIAEGTPPEQALGPAGLLLEKPGIPSPVAQELVRSLAVWISPDRIPHLLEWLELADAAEGAAEPRAEFRAALDAVAIHLIAVRTQGGSAPPSDAAWARQIRAMPRPNDAVARETYDICLALLGEAGFVDQMRGDLRAGEWTRRERVAVLLGLCKSPEAERELSDLARQPDEGPRLLALRGLACRPEFRADPFLTMQPRVRAVLADCLAARPEATYRPVLLTLLRDSHPQVSLAAVTALRDWPNVLAEPLLLEAATEGTAAQRRAAYVQLRRMRPDSEFPIEADLAVRREASRAWMQTWHVPGSIELARAERVATGTAKVPDADRSAQLQTWLERRNEWKDQPADADSVWSRFEPGDVAWLEQQLPTSDPDLARFLGDELLPRLSPAYAAFRDLAASDVQARRGAARRLRAAADERSLPELILLRLSEQLQSEQDLEVWQAIMRAVENDASPGAIAVARTAAHAPWPDVRSLALDYAARHRPPEAVQWVLPLLAERHPRLQPAAVRLAGVLGDRLVLDGTRDADGATIYAGLRPLLAETEGQLRSDVVLAMARLGDSAGLEELARLARHSDPAVRLSAVQAMGQSGQMRFVEPLVQLLWTESVPAIQTAGLESLAQLVPTERHPVLPVNSEFTERVRAWASAVTP